MFFPYVSVLKERKRSASQECQVFYAHSSESTKSKTTEMKTYRTQASMMAKMDAKILSSKVPPEKAATTRQRATTRRVSSPGLVSKSHSGPSSPKTSSVVVLAVSPEFPALRVWSPRRGGPGRRRRHGRTEVDLLDDNPVPTWVALPSPLPGLPAAKLETLTVLPDRIRAPRRVAAALTPLPFRRISILAPPPWSCPP